MRNNFTRRVCHSLEDDMKSGILIGGRVGMFVPLRR